MTTVTTPPFRLNLASAASAFENWENDFRANPQSFYTAEETAAMAVATVSGARAIHFLALLRDLPVIDAPPAAGEIWPGQGGRYICTVAASDGLPERHLVFGTSEAEDLAYGPYIDVPGASSMNDGRANTAALLASGSKHPAAEWAAAYTEDGHTDFHLPSRVDLVLAHAHAKAHFSKDDYYLSSTQLSRLSAFVQDFEHGHSGWYGKDGEHRVRACRWIHLTA